MREAVLLQGRTGFTKVIILLKGGCEEYGNTEGLGQKRFPSGNISVSFEDVGRVLECEDLPELA